MNTIKTYVLHFREVSAERGKKKYKVVTESGHKFCTPIEVWKGRHIVLTFYGDGTVNTREYY